MSKVTNNNEWYQEWFNHLYPKIYPQRNLIEAQTQVEAVVKLLGAKNTCLDIACGTGRHLKYLANHFKDANGFDLSEDLIRIGKEQGNFVNSKVKLADMRKPPYAKASFDLVTNFFTGFGYFRTDAEHSALLKTWSNLVNDQGALLIDYLNREHVIKNLVPETTRTIDDYKVVERRKLSDSGLRIEKSIEISSPNFCKTFHESVRMYNITELTEMLKETSLKHQDCYGDFDWKAFDENSPRLIIVGRNVR